MIPADSPPPERGPDATAPAPEGGQDDVGDEATEPLILTAERASERLDAFLVRLLGPHGHSRAEVQGWIEQDRVEVRASSGHAGLEPPRSLKRSQKLRLGEQVLVWVPPPAPPPGPLRAEDLPIPIIHQDEALLVLDKPAGLTVHPGAGQRDGTLVNALLHLSPGALSTLGGEERPGIVHRLDKDTSGVIAVARDDRAHRLLARQFHDRQVTKRYLALARIDAAPALRRDEGLIDAFVGRHPKDRKRMAVVPSGTPGARAARTRFRVLERFGRCALIECAPETGRTHQIRVHLKSLGAPILADVTYGGLVGADGALRARDLGLEASPDELLLARHALHAARLELTHPTTGAHMVFEAPLHPDMARTLDRLRAGR